MSILPTRASKTHGSAGSLRTSSGHSRPLYDVNGRAHPGGAGCRAVDAAKRCCCQGGGTSLGAGLRRNDRRFTGDRQGPSRPAAPRSAGGGGLSVGVPRLPRPRRRPHRGEQLRAGGFLGPLAIWGPAAAGCAGATARSQVPFPAGYITRDNALNPVCLRAVGLLGRLLRPSAAAGTPRVPVPS